MGKRQDTRDRIERQIVEIGRAHLVTHGAAALSLRAIARELGMVSSAVYRYVASRDELLTLLLVDAYGELADSVERARDAAAGDWQDRLRAVAHATRAWAVHHPARWALLYGSPVPGYHAPREQTVGPGTRVVGLLFSAIAEGVAAGAVRTSKVTVPQSLSSDFDRLRAEFEFVADDDVVARCLVLWAALVGAISLEVFGQYGADTFADASVVFDAQMDLVIDLFCRQGAN
ncbi:MULTISPECIES: TetR/AcrR family transcriptional regulator [Mycolicibacterium]|uniref:TetR/AcrR family transcriptional regulator n=1 Tax=Mycolicibacterium austroafricanum TaxID=39687 RepID=A0ABT8HD53_MYCAO|nr:MULTISPECIES: TetR/AcrR family transcriptional regulator [Mycolicibacterium]MCV7129550.1 TetR/AcrR family transcriptional regulator [Mycolicibacterium vanbaalenii PYR-1]MDN4518691.1 TetR/AcrR family transcriptional regulator [Mycolicibacterium austroafricanum]PQP49703.1 TetR/AcrR family transcriptional regulator [Mycolicibacterium austroafricanum]QRZ04381.1 TetR/AcrR family transcriptional regulator [Mycolicibacterium austroafricanum]QZT54513.1 TetR/AcrR family transcriptional regulator [My